MRAHTLQALTIAAGLVLAALLKRQLGLQGLGGVDECELWRQIAAGYRYSQYTDEQRNTAAGQWNKNCQFAGRSKEQTAGQAAARWIQQNPSPRPSDFPAYVIPAPACPDPSNGACVACAEDVLRYNLVAIDNARRAYRFARCQYDCRRNTAAGNPSVCRQCDQFAARTLPPRPECGATAVRALRSGGDVQIPTATRVAAEPNNFPVATASDEQSTDTGNHQKRKQSKESGNQSDGGEKKTAVKNLLTEQWEKRPWLLVGVAGAAFALFTSAD